MSRRLASATSRMRARADAAAVEVGEDLGLRVAGDRRAARRPRRRASSSRFTSHGGEKPSVVVGARARCAPGGRAGRCRARRRSARRTRRPRAATARTSGCMLDERVDREDLPGLQVHPDVHREPRVLAQSARRRSHPGSLLRRGASARTAAPTGSPTLTLPMRRVALLSMVLIVFARGRVWRLEVLLARRTREPASQAEARRSAGSSTSSPRRRRAARSSRALGDNSVKVVFGETNDDAEQIELAYDHFAFAEREGRPPRRAPPLRQRGHALARAPAGQRPRARHRLPEVAGARGGRLR